MWTLGRNGIWQSGLGNLDLHLWVSVEFPESKTSFICIFLLLIAYFLKGSLGGCLLRPISELSRILTGRTQWTRWFNYWDYFQRIGDHIIENCGFIDTHVIFFDSRIRKMNAELYFHIWNGDCRYNSIVYSQFVMTTLGGKLISIFKRAGKLFPAQTLINLWIGFLVILFFHRLQGAAQSYFMWSQAEKPTWD